MAIEVAACASVDEVLPAVAPVFHYFSPAPTPADAERFVPFMEPSRVFAAREGGAIVGGCGSFPFELTVPGGVVRTAGLSVVGVLPTHRRRGILRAMMRAHLDDVRRRGEPVGYLWASEDTIYGQFGYGQASMCGNIDVPKAHARLAQPSTVRAELKLLSDTEALELLPGVYDRVRREHPGMIARSADWWRLRRLADPEHRRMGGGPLQCVALLRDGEPRGYALYRIHQQFEGGTTVGHVTVIEAIGADFEATRDLWGFLFDIDWVAGIKATQLPLDHPLLLMAARPRELKLLTHDGVWVRLVDVPAALTARRLGEGDPVVIEVADDFCPWNAGRWRVAAGSVDRTTAAADLACDVTALGSVYLGGFSFRGLARAGLVQEVRAGALARADALFPSDRLPWCPENF
jgi:predicted acetyltransferase